MRRHVPNQLLLFTVAVCATLIAGCVNATSAGERSATNASEPVSLAPTALGDYSRPSLA